MIICGFSFTLILMIDSRAFCAVVLFVLLCAVISPAVEEGIAVLDDGDRLPGEVVAGVGEEGEHKHGDPEHPLPPPGEAREQAGHLEQRHAWSQLHCGVICNHHNNLSLLIEERVYTKTQSINKAGHMTLIL